MTNFRWKRTTIVLCSMLFVFGCSVLAEAPGPRLLWSQYSGRILDTLSLSDDGRLIATNCRLFDDKGKVLWKNEQYAYGSGIRNSCISGDGSTVVAGMGGYVSDVLFIDGKGEVARRWKGSGRCFIQGVSVSSDGKSVALGQKGKAILLDAKAEPLWQKPIPGGVEWTAISPDGKHVGVSSPDGTVRLLDRSGKILWQRKTGGWDTRVSVSERCLAVGYTLGKYPYARGHVRVYDLKGKQLWDFTACGSEGSARVAVCARGDYVVACSSYYGLAKRYGFAYFFDVKGRLIWKEKMPGGYVVGGVAVDKAGDRVAVHSKDGNVYFFDNSKARHNRGVDVGDSVVGDKTVSAERKPFGHPCVLFRASEIPALKKALKSPRWSGWYAKQKATAERMVKADLATVKGVQKRWGSVALGLIYLVEGRQDCADKAKELLIRLPELVKGDYGGNAMTQSYGCQAYPLAYDLIYSGLTQNERQKIEANLKAHMEPVYHYLPRKTPFNNWRPVLSAGIGITAVVLDMPSYVQTSEFYMDEYLDVMIKPDGGNVESVGYLTMTTGEASQFMVVLDHLGGKDYFKERKLTAALKFLGKTRRTILGDSFYGLSEFRPPEKAVWSDEFGNHNSRWDWKYNKGTGYKQLTMIDGVSVVEIGITDQSSSSSYSDCSLHEKRYQYHNGVFEARLRYAGDQKFGTIGWGFWNYEDGATVQCAWFFDSSTGGNASGFQVMVAGDSDIKFQKHLPEIDIKKWHIYRVELLPTGTRFFVDGDEVAATSKRPSKLQRSEIWIDNYRLQVIDGKTSRAGYLNIQQDQRIYVDWVRYYVSVAEKMSN